MAAMKFEPLYEPLEAGAAVFDIAFHDAEPVIAAATITGGISLYYCPNDKDEVSALRDFHADQKAVRSLQFNNSNTLAYGTRSGLVSALDAETFVPAFEALAHSEGVTKVRWLDTSILASGGDDGMIKVFDIRARPVPGKGIVAVIEECDDQIFDLKALETVNQLVVATGDQLAVFDLRRPNGLVAMSDHLDVDLLSFDFARQNSARNPRVVCGTSNGPLAIFVEGDWGDLKERVPGVSKCSNAVVRLAGRDDTVIVGGDDGSLYVAQILPNIVAGVLGRQVEPEETVDDNQIPPIDVLATQGPHGLIASASFSDERIWFYSMKDAFSLVDDATGEGKKPAPVLSHRKIQAAEFLEDL